MRTTLLAGFLLAGALGIAIADGDSGFPMWLRLRSDEALAKERLAELEAETGALRVEIEALEREPFALERAIREDLQLARPGELVVRFDGSGEAGLRQGRSKR